MLKFLYDLIICWIYPIWFALNAIVEIETEYGHGNAYRNEKYTVTHRRVPTQFVFQFNFKSYPRIDLNCSIEY